MTAIEYDVNESFNKIENKNLNELEDKLQKNLPTELRAIRG